KRRNARTYFFPGPGFFVSPPAPAFSGILMSYGTSSEPPSKGTMISPTNARWMHDSIDVPAQGAPTPTSVMRPFVPSKVTFTSPDPPLPSGTLSEQFSAFFAPRLSTISICSRCVALRPPEPSLLPELGPDVSFEGLSDHLVLSVGSFHVDVSPSG